MYAVVKTGGKQYRVSKDDVIIVEKLTAEPGATVELDQVLALDDGKSTSVGTPLVDGARVAATVIDQARSNKVLVFKKKRRKDYTRLKGHRQQITVLRITDILPKGAKAATRAAESKPKAEEKPAEAAAPAETAAPAKKAVKKSAKKTAKKAAKKSAAKKSAKKAAKKSAAKKSAAAKKKEDS